MIVALTGVIGVASVFFCRDATLGAYLGQLPLRRGF